MANEPDCSLGNSIQPRGGNNLPAATRHPLDDVMLFRTSILMSLIFALYTSSAAQTGGGMAHVEGTVLNKLTGAPVRHAQVMYIKVGMRAGEMVTPISSDTDPSGHFALQLDPGDYRLWVERAGYSRQAWGARTSEGTGATLTLAPDQQIHDITLKIVPLGAISGRVLDDEGEPVQGAGIQVLRFSYAGGTRQFMPVAGASSNDRGEYRVYGLPAGRYYLLATLRGAPPTRPIETGVLIPEAQEPYAPMYYPGVPDAASATQLPLAQGAELSDIDFHLQRVRAVTLRGRLFSPLDDFTRGQVQVVLAHNDGSGASFIDRAAAAIEKTTGRFELRGVAPGLYWLVASQLNGGYSLGGRTPVEVTAPNSQENLTISLRASFDIAGAITVEGKPPVSLTALTASLSPSEGLALGPQPTAKVGADGRFRLTGVTPGLWDFTIGPLPEGVRIKTAMFGEHDILRGELIVPEGPRGSLQIVLSGNGAQVSGTVGEDDHPHAATVVLVPDSEDLRRSPRLYRSTQAREQGRFVFKGVPPGSYRLFAFDEVEPNAWLDPDFLKPVESLGEPISLAEGEQATRQLTLVPSDALLPQR